MDAGKLNFAVVAVEKAMPLQIGNRPRQGMELFGVKVKVVNNGGEAFGLYRGSFRLLLSDRTRVEPLEGKEPGVPYSTQIAPGASFEGWLTFEVPSNARIDGVIWAPDRETSYQLGV